MRELCGKAVEMLRKTIAQVSDNCVYYTAGSFTAPTPRAFVNNVCACLSSETAINTQPKMHASHPISAYLYTLYTGPITTTNLNKEMNK